MSSEDGQKKQGIVSKLADKLHIGHKKKNSTSSAGTSDDVMSEVGLSASWSATWKQHLALRLLVENLSCNLLCCCTSLTGCELGGFSAGAGQHLRDRASAGEPLRADLNWLQAPLAAGAQHGHSSVHGSAANPSTGAGSTATGKPLPPMPLALLACTAAPADCAISPLLATDCMLRSRCSNIWAPLRLSKTPEPSA